MQIVIDIDEEIYKKYMDDWIHSTDVLHAVRLGTPLPKGHGRLKDIDRLESHDEYDGQGFTKSVYKDDIDTAPTIIEADKENDTE